MLLISSSSPPPSRCLSSCNPLYFSLPDTVEVTGPVLPLSLISGSLCKGVLAHLLFLAPITLIKAVPFSPLFSQPPPFKPLSVDINDSSTSERGPSPLSRNMPYTF